MFLHLGKVGGRFYQLQHPGDLQQDHKGGNEHWVQVTVFSSRNVNAVIQSCGRKASGVVAPPESACGQLCKGIPSSQRRSLTEPGWLTKMAVHAHAACGSSLSCPTGDFMFFVIYVKVFLSVIIVSHCLNTAVSIYSTSAEPHYQT